MALSEQPVFAGALHAAVVPAYEHPSESTAFFYFATVINDSTEVAKNCRIELDPDLPLHFTYWTTDQTDNSRTGQDNESVDLWPRKSQSFALRIIALENNSEDKLRVLFPIFACDNLGPAIKILDVNSIDLTAFPLGRGNKLTREQIEKGLTSGDQARIQILR